MILQEAIDLLEDQDKFEFFVKDEKVKFYNEWGGLDAKFYLFGFEYGATHLIHARSESDAYECWCDLLPPVPFDEIHEAYNAFDKMLEWMEKKGHENNYDLRSFCSRWCKTFFEIDTRDANYTGAWDRWELGEGYQYQSNATDSGVVHVGHYEWMREIPATEIQVQRKV